MLRVSSVFMQQQFFHKIEDIISYISQIGVLHRNYFLDKIAEKFAKKNKFSYEKITPNLSKKEQKLSLDRACLKYLKKNVETDNPLNTSTNDSSKKRSIDNGNESEENDLQTPKAKKKVIIDI